MKLSEGDLVVVIGSTTSKAGEVERHRVLATVIGIGKSDLFLQAESGGKVFISPKVRCLKINDDAVTSRSDPIRPQLGDLVMSINERFTKVERKMGVLVEVIDIPGKYKTAKLLQGETTEFVSFDTLLVLE